MSILERDDLSGADLSGFSLGARDLIGKNLRGADLSHAHLGGANLSGADLRNANLCFANLGAANLTGADLRFCDLTNANMAGAPLNGADFRDAVGLDIASPVPLSQFVRPLTLEETEDYRTAKEDGFYPLSHWGHSYSLNDGNTLYKSSSVWYELKERLGDVIFGDHKTFSEVCLVRQYKEYSQWAYMISCNGFERITHRMGLKLKKKK